MVCLKFDALVELNTENPKVSFFIIDTVKGVSRRSKRNIVVEANFQVLLLRFWSKSDSMVVFCDV